MTYNVFGGTLNLTQSINQSRLRGECLSYSVQNSVINIYIILMITVLWCYLIHTGTYHCHTPVEVDETFL